MGLKCKRFVEGNECLDRMREKAASNTLMGRSVKSSNHTAHLIPLKGGKREGCTDIVRLQSYHSLSELKLLIVSGASLAIRYATMMLALRWQALLH